MKYLLLLILIACNNPTSPQAPKTEVPELGKTDMPWGVQNEWDEKLEYAIRTYAKDALKVKPYDWAAFSNSFPESEDKRVQFYMVLLSSMSKFESNWNPATKYREKFRDGSGQYVISRGHLQVSGESCKGYGTKLSSYEELHKPEKNFECGARILNKWVSRDKYITGRKGGWKGLGRYFSVMRNNDRTNKIKAMVKKRF